MESLKDGIKGLSMVFCFDGSCAYKIFVVVTFPIWIVTIIMGSLYLGECPLQPFFQIYLIIAGVVGSMKCILNIIQWLSYGQPDEDGPCMDFMWLDLAFIFFFLIWTIVGTYMVQDGFKNLSFIITDPDYCNETLCWYTLFFSVICDVLFVGKVIFYLRFMCCDDCCQYQCLKKQSEYQSINRSNA